MHQQINPSQQQQPPFSPINVIQFKSITPKYPYPLSPPALPHDTHPKMTPQPLPGIPLTTSTFEQAPTTKSFSKTPKSKPISSPYISVPFSSKEDNKRRKNTEVKRKDMFDDSMLRELAEDYENVSSYRIVNDDDEMVISSKRKMGGKQQQQQNNNKLDKKQKLQKKKQREQKEQSSIQLSHHESAPVEMQPVYPNLTRYTLNERITYAKSPQELLERAQRQQQLQQSAQFNHYQQQKKYQQQYEQQYQQLYPQYPHQQQPHHQTPLQPAAFRHIQQSNTLQDEQQQQYQQQPQYPPQPIRSKSAKNLRAPNPKQSLLNKKPSGYFHKERKQSIREKPGLKQYDMDVLEQQAILSNFRVSDLHFLNDQQFLPRNLLARHVTDTGRQGIGGNADNNGIGKKLSSANHSFKSGQSHHPIFRDTIQYINPSNKFNIHQRFLQHTTTLHPQPSDHSSLSSSPLTNIDTGFRGKYKRYKQRYLNMVEVVRQFQALNQTLIRDQRENFRYYEDTIRHLEGLLVGKDREIEELRSIVEQEGDRNRSDRNSKELCSIEGRQAQIQNQRLRRQLQSKQQQLLTLRQTLKTLDSSFQQLTSATQQSRLTQTRTLEKSSKKQDLLKKEKQSLAKKVKSLEELNKMYEEKMKDKEERVSRLSEMNSELQEEVLRLKVRVRLGEKEREEGVGEQEGKEEQEEREEGFRISFAASSSHNNSKKMKEESSNNNRREMSDNNSNMKREEGDNQVTSCNLSKNNNSNNTNNNGLITPTNPIDMNKHQNTPTPSSNPSNPPPYPSTISPPDPTTPHHPPTSSSSHLQQYLTCIDTQLQMIRTHLLSSSPTSHPSTTSSLSLHLNGIGESSNEKRRLQESQKGQKQEKKEKEEKEKRDKSEEVSLKDLIQAVDRLASFRASMGG